MFQEDLTAFYQGDDFATTATYDGATPVLGLFDAQFVALLDLVESSGPMFRTALAWLPGIAKGKSFLINGAGFTAREIHRDTPTMGEVTVLLSKV